MPSMFSVTPYSFFFTILLHDQREHEKAAGRKLATVKATVNLEIGLRLRDHLTKFCFLKMVPNEVLW